MSKGIRYKIIIALGCIMGLWVTASLVSGIIAAGGVSMLIGQYMTAVGMTATFSTLVEYYTYIKGIEYLICVIFFVTFPIFFKYINTDVQIKKVSF